MIVIIVILLLLEREKDVLVVIIVQLKHTIFINICSFFLSPFGFLMDSNAV